MNKVKNVVYYCGIYLVFKQSQNKQSDKSKMS